MARLRVRQRVEELTPVTHLFMINVSAISAIIAHFRSLFRVQTLPSPSIAKKKQQEKKTSKRYQNSRPLGISLHITPALSIPPMCIVIIGPKYGIRNVVDIAQYQIRN
jgi:hypothetical protein